MSLQWRNKQKGKCQAPKETPQRNYRKTENSSFHLLQQEWALSPVPCWKISLWIAGWTFPPGSQEPLILPQSCPHPFCPTLSKLISAVLLAGVAIWPLLATLERHLKTGLKSGGILLKMHLWCPGPLKGK